MSYQDGYDTTYAEVGGALDDLDHARHCVGCCPCGVMKSVIEWSMQGLGQVLKEAAREHLADAEG